MASSMTRPEFLRAEPPVPSARSAEFSTEPVPVRLEPVANSRPSAVELTERTWPAVPRARVVTAPSVVVTTGRPAVVPSLPSSVRLPWV
jgi:hypothetical protein